MCFGMYFNLRQLVTWLITRQSLPHYFGPHYCQATHFFSTGYVIEKIMGCKLWYVSVGWMVMNVKSLLCHEGQSYQFDLHWLYGEIQRGLTFHTLVMGIENGIAPMERNLSQSSKIRCAYINQSHFPETIPKTYWGKKAKMAYVQCIHCDIICNSKRLKETQYIHEME